MSPPEGKNRQENHNGLFENEENDGRNKIVLLDGGFATQLSCHVQQQIDGDILWSARFLKTNPEAVIESHLDFLRGTHHHYRFLRFSMELCEMKSLTKPSLSVWYLHIYISHMCR